MVGIGALLVVFAAALGTTSGQSAATQSGCEVCATTGDCAEAYRGGEGQFCGNWLDRSSQRRPCCCPTNAVCKVSNYACNCAYSGGASPYRGDNEANSLLWLWWLLGALILVVCCGGCCFMLFNRSKQRRDDNEVPTATPVPTPYPDDIYTQPYGSTGTSTYANAAPQSVYANAPPMISNGYRRGGGMGAGTGAALGGAAGLLGGLWLGETLADHGDNGDGGYGGYDGGDGGYDGGGGGGDFAGDF